MSLLKTLLLDQPVLVCKAGITIAPINVEFDDSVYLKLVWSSMITAFPWTGADTNIA